MILIIIASTKKKKKKSKCLQSGDYMPGSVLKNSKDFTYINSLNPHNNSISTVIISILQRTKAQKD